MSNHPVNIVNYLNNYTPTHYPLCSVFVHLTLCLMHLTLDVEKRKNILILPRSLGRLNFLRCISFRDSVYGLFHSWGIFSLRRKCTTGNWGLGKIDVRHFRPRQGGGDCGTPSPTPVSLAIPRLCVLHFSYFFQNIIIHQSMVFYILALINDSRLSRIMKTEPLTSSGSIVYLFISIYWICRFTR